MLQLIFVIIWNFNDYLYPDIRNLKMTLIRLVLVLGTKTAA